MADMQTIVSKANEEAGDGEGFEVEDTGGGVMVAMSTTTRGRWVEVVDVAPGRVGVVVRSHDDDGAPEWVWEGESEGAALAAVRDALANVAATGPRKGDRVEAVRTGHGAYGAGVVEWATDDVVAVRFDSGGRLTCAPEWVTFA